MQKGIKCTDISRAERGDECSIHIDECLPALAKCASNLCAQCIKYEQTERCYNTVLRVVQINVHLLGTSCSEPTANTQTYNCIQ